jgi:RNA polymerase sigma-70 factor (ECF subfamily)
MLDLMCGDLAVAEELAQETLARTWTNWRKVSTYEAPAAWTTRVAVNLATSHFRRRRAERKAHGRVAAGTTSTMTDPDTAGAVALRAAVVELPPRMRTAVVLRYFLDLPFVEVAQIMDAPETTVRSLVHRALKRLRSDFDRSEEKEASHVR